MSRVLKPSGSQIEEREDVLDRGNNLCKNVREKWKQAAGVHSEAGKAMGSHGQVLREGVF